MKEKTFEELIVQLFPNHKLTKDRWSFELIQFSADDLIEFGIKVRESTIAECEQYIEDNPEIALDFTRGREIKINLQADRIKTEK